MTAHKRKSLTIIWTRMIARGYIQLVELPVLYCVHRKSLNVASFKHRELENKLKVYIIMYL